MLGNKKLLYIFLYIRPLRIVNIFLTYPSGNAPGI